MTVLFPVVSVLPKFDLIVCMNPKYKTYILEFIKLFYFYYLHICGAKSIDLADCDCSEIRVKRSAFMYKTQPCDIPSSYCIPAA